MTNTVKSSVWSFTFIDPGLLLKKILGSKPRPAFYTVHQLIYTKNWFHPVLAHSLPTMLNLYRRVQLERAGKAQHRSACSLRSLFGDRKPKGVSLSCPTKHPGACDAPQRVTLQGTSSNSGLKVSKAALRWLLVRNGNFGIQTHIWLPCVFHKPSSSFGARLQSLDWNPISFPRVGRGF